MSNTKDKTDKGVQMDSKRMDDLQAQLDIEVFEQEEMDVDKVKAILAEMEDYTPDTEKKTFDKEQLWKRIEEQSREEFAAEQMLSFDKSKAGKKRKGVTGGAGDAGRGAKIRRIALTAATIVIAVFIGANIGTYATEKKSVFEYVGDLKNGTSFWITGDAPSMDVEKEKHVYYSWNDVPNEYKEFLVIPQGLPEDMELYEIEISVNDVFEDAMIKYLNSNAKSNLYIKITAYQGDEFSFAQMLHEEEYNIIEQKNISGVEIYYCDAQLRNVVQCLHDKYIYVFSGNLEKDMLISIVENTVDLNF